MCLRCGIGGGTKKDVYERKWHTVQNTIPGETDNAQLMAGRSLESWKTQGFVGALLVLRRTTNTTTWVGPSRSTVHSRDSS